MLTDFSISTCLTRGALVFILSIIQALLLPGVQAEFLRTGPLTYQSTDKCSKVVVSQQEPGLFIAYSCEQDIQTFDPALLLANTTTHLFVHFDPTFNRYSKVSVGPHEYRINGSLSILISGNLRLTIDNNNPYLTLVTGDINNSSGAPGREAPGVLGFKGLSEVVNAVGLNALLLEATQFHEYRQLIVPYELSGQDLKLRGQSFNGDMVGVDLVVKNPCLEKNSLILSRADLKAASQAPSVEAKKALLAKVVKSNSKKSPLANHLRLRITKEEVITLNYVSGEIFLVRELPNFSEGRSVCVMEPRTLAK